MPAAASLRKAKHAGLSKASSDTDGFFKSFACLMNIDLTNFQNNMPLMWAVDKTMTVIFCRRIED